LLGFLAGLAGGLIVNFTAGGEAGWVVWLTTWVTQPVGTIFLRLLFMLVIPLLFSALAVGVAEMGDIRSLGRIGWKTLAYAAGVSSAAVLLGMLLVIVLRPGDGVDPALAERLLGDAADRAQSIVASAREGSSGISMLVNIVPDNVIRAAAGNDVLAVRFFALMFGIGLVLARGRPGTETPKNALEGLFEVMMTLIHLVI